VYAAHDHLGRALMDNGQVDEALAEHRKGLDLNPEYALGYINLGRALYAKGRLDDAGGAFRTAIKLRPELAMAHTNLGVVLHEQGQLDEAIKEHHEAIRLRDDLAIAHGNLGNVLRDKGEWDEAITEYRRAVEGNPNVNHVLGEALLHQGRFAEAAEALRRWLQLLPDQHPQRPTARRLIARCEEFLALDRKLPAMIRGDVQPESARERLTLAELCQSHKQRYALSARFYADAFADQPPLGDDLAAAHRYNAACAAALAGCGRGEDAKRLPDKVAQALRRQALAWLRTELTAWAAHPDRAAIRRTMRHWQKDTDLAGVRDPGALDQLPEAERQEWRRLWGEAAALLAQAGAAP
jgi:tetratricopeptide (TPR) repeat protein